jgi:hypothetical protein
MNTIPLSPSLFLSTPTLDDPEAVIDQENREGEKEGKLEKKAIGNKTNQPKDTEGKGTISLH